MCYISADFFIVIQMKEQLYETKVNIQLNRSCTEFNIIGMKLIWLTEIKLFKSIDIKG